jgi:DNA-binding transcriptional regulator YdaS (Cro superfamily)
MGKSRAKKNPIERAIERAGSEHKLAEITGFSQPAINKAKSSEEPNEKLALRIHHWSEGEIPAWETRPDLWTKDSVLPEREKAFA